MMIINKKNNSKAVQYSCQCLEKMCFECSRIHYWSNSKDDIKSFATCPTCKNEYTLEDIHMIHFSGSNEEMRKLEVKATTQEDEIKALKKKVKELEHKMDNKIITREERKDRRHNPYVKHIHKKKNPPSQKIIL